MEFGRRRAKPDPDRERGVFALDGMVQGGEPLPLALEPGTRPGVQAGDLFGVFLAQPGTEKLQ